MATLAAKSTGARGILKTSSSGEHQSLASSSPLDDGRKTLGRSRTLQWDEETIAKHDEERGTRMTVNEPRTPYYGAMSSEDEEDLEEGARDTLEPLDLGGAAVDADQLQKRLEELLEKSEEKNSDFVQHRKAHYNEFKVVKELALRNEEDEDVSD